MSGAAYWQVQDDAAADLGAGRPAAAQAQGRAGRSTVVVEYGGATTRPEDIEGALYGWVTTRDGAMVANEPDGAMTWYPVSDHPTDKATYGFDITVPEGKVAVANGLPRREPTTDDGWTTWYWDGPRPAGELPRRPRRSVTTTSGSPRRRTACRSSTRSTTP